MQDNGINVFDVASYILSKTNEITSMKLQKLVYYSQVWFLVFKEKVLFNENIEAWVRGPVVRELYEINRGMLYVSSIINGDPTKLTKEQKEIIDKVIKVYGKLTGQELSDLTHSEAPWLDARKDCEETQRSSCIIPVSELYEYYSTLPPENTLENVLKK